MAKFVVTQIIDACSIRVAPKWKFTRGNVEIIDDRVRISGLNTSPDDPYIKHRLASFLINREVDLVNPSLISTDINEVRVTCNVLLDNTDVTYFFPELSTPAVIG